MKVVKEKFGNKKGRMAKILEEMVYLHKDLSLISFLRNAREGLEG